MLYICCVTVRDTSPKKKSLRLAVSFQTHRFFARNAIGRVIKWDQLRVYSSQREKEGRLAKGKGFLRRFQKERKLKKMKYCFVKTFSVPYASLKVSYAFGVYFLVFDVRWFTSRFEILF